MNHGKVQSSVVVMIMVVVRWTHRNFIEIIGLKEKISNDDFVASGNNLHKLINYLQKKSMQNIIRCFIIQCFKFVSFSSGKWNISTSTSWYKSISIFSSKF